MKNYAIFLILLASSTFFFEVAVSQNVAINSDGSSPDTSAVLDLQSANKGLLVPRLSLSSLTDADNYSASGSQSPCL